MIIGFRIADHVCDGMSYERLIVDKKCENWNKAGKVENERTKV